MQTFVERLRRVFAMLLSKLINIFRSFILVPCLIIGFLCLSDWFQCALAPTAKAILTQAIQIIHKEEIPSSGNKELDALILQAGERHGVDPRLIHAVVWKESKYRNNLQSPRGALGLMQLLPSTARRFDCANINDPAANIEAGTKYLRWLLERYNGDVALALAGYNAGEGAVDKYDKIPPYEETQDYVREIISRYGKTFHPILSPEKARIEFQLI